MRNGGFVLHLNARDSSSDFPIALELFADDLARRSEVQFAIANLDRKCLLNRNKNWETEMMRVLYYLLFASLIAMPLMSQQNHFSSSDSAPKPEASGIVSAKPMPEPLKAFSRFGVGGGIGIGGVNLQAATNLNRYSNLRVSGNVFSYGVSDITTNGFTANGNLDFATLGASFDYFPWPTHGFRVSTGLLLYNENSLTASAMVASGQSFTLNDVDYYSMASNPIRAKAKVGLNATNPAFTLTTGWGNMISRKGGHWSFPFELGAAFVGSPSFKMTMTGTACDSTGTTCVNAATDSGVQHNLQAQIDKYKKDVDALKVFPIFSIGVSYNFDIRKR